MGVGRELSSTTVDAVIDQMLNGVPPEVDAPSAACALPNTLHEPIGQMYDARFPTQMRTVTEDYAELRPGLTCAPDLYLFTTWSAIPLMETVRGYYDASDLGPTPQFGIIYSDTLQQDNPENMLGRRNMRREIARLATVHDVLEAQHVCVVDEWTISGRTLSYAYRLLDGAGVETASAIRGKWYFQAREVDRQALTTPYAEKMHSAGLRAAELAREVHNAL